MSVTSYHIGSVRPRGKGFQADFRWKGERVRSTEATEQAAWDWIRTGHEKLLAGDAVVKGGKVLVNTPEGQASDTPDTMAKLADYTYTMHWSRQGNHRASRCNAKDVARILGNDLNPKQVDGPRLMKMVAAAVHEGPVSYSGGCR